MSNHAPSGANAPSATASSSSRLFTRSRVALAVVVALIAVLLSGPRTIVNEPEAAVDGGPFRLTATGPTPRPVALAALPAWLADAEQTAGVRDPDVAKRIVFAGDTVRTAYSVVYLHGFSATRQETAPLPEDVARALSANLFETRLAGHGLPGDSMGAVAARDWLVDANEGLAIGQQLGDSVIVIGTSTGGTLAVWLATRPVEDRTAIHSIVLISPNFGPRDKASAVLTMPWSNVVLPRFIPAREWTPRNDAQRRYWTVRYPSTALFPMQALVEHVRAIDVRAYNTPTLVFQNENDDVVDARRTHAWVAQVHAATDTRVDVVPVTPEANEDGHVLAGRVVSPSQTATFVERILQFVKRERGAPR